MCASARREHQDYQRRLWKGPLCRFGNIAVKILVHEAVVRGRMFCENRTVMILLPSRCMEPGRSNRAKQNLC